MFEHELGKVEKAIDTYARVLELDPDDLTALGRLDVLYQTAQNWPELLSVLTHESELCDDPHESISYQYRIAELYEKHLNDVDRAVELYREILNIQTGHLPTLNARENVALPLHLAHVSRREATARSVAMLELVGLADRQEHLPDELSGGEQQRVAMARALVLRPPLILADEPTGNLDSSNGEEVLSLFKRLQSQFNTTVMMVTHDSRAATFCDRILQMQDGRMI